MRQRREVVLRIQKEVSEYADLCKIGEEKISPEVLIKMMKDATGWVSVINKGRRRENIFKRGIFDLLATSNGCTISECARATDREHTTVMNSLRSIEDTLDTDMNSRNALREIVNYIKENKDYYLSKEGSE